MILRHVYIIGDEFVGPFLWPSGGRYARRAGDITNHQADPIGVPLPI